MYQASQYEVWVEPLVRERAVLVPMVLFWFVVQFISQRLLLPRIPGWSRFKRVDQEDLIIRAVSIANGMIMMMSAAIFLTNLYTFYDMRLPEDLYAEVHVPTFPFFRTAIVSYFIWDLITCFWFGWAWAWKIHAIASILGSTTLLFPFSDVYAGFYTGCFEVSNAFLHISSSFRLVSSYNTGNKRLASFLDHRATLCEYVFALLFTVIRVIGGSIVTYRWISVAGANLLHDLTHSGEAGFVPRCHNITAYVVAIVCIGTIQLLQYVWFTEIVKRAIGVAGGADGAAAASTTTTPATADGSSSGSGKGGEAVDTEKTGGRGTSQKRRARKED